MEPDFEFELRYDLRNPDRWALSWPEHYSQFLEQVAFADAVGFDVVDLNEHHFSPDGYLPTPLVMAAAIAARTTRIRIRLGVILLPLKHPVALAEELSVLDNLSGGRIEAILGAGYRPAEYAGFGVDLSERGNRMDEAVAILRGCWENEGFSFSGRFWTGDGVTVSPKPFQRPHPPILLGGNSPAAARRAARLADGYVPTSTTSMELWRTEMAALGHELPAAERLSMRQPIGARTFVHVASDPSAEWAVVGEHALYSANAYAEWTGETPFDDADALLRSGEYAVITPAEALAQARAAVNAGVRAKLRLQPKIGGLEERIGRRSMQLVVDEVMTPLRETEIPTG